MGSLPDASEEELEAEWGGSTTTATTNTTTTTNNNRNYNDKGQGQIASACDQTLGTPTTAEARSF